jgi:hypothetical protein
MTPDARALAPVFIVGAPRSGTAWLFHLLLSAGGFSASNDRDMLGGPDGQRRIHCFPEDLLQVEAIKARVPDALFLHIVRDGRDVACSLARHQARQKPGSHAEATDVLDSALYWEWMLRHGRQQIRRMGADALEVRFEAMVAEPRDTLDAVGQFLAHDVNHDAIRERGIGVVREPNTAFEDDAIGPWFRPVGRWQRRLSIGRVARVEAAVGSLLEDLGYSLYTNSVARSGVASRVRFRRSFAQPAFSILHWIRTRAPMGWSWTRRPRTREGGRDDQAVRAPAPRKHTV